MPPGCNISSRSLELLVAAAAGAFFGLSLASELARTSTSTQIRDLVRGLARPVDPSDAREPDLVRRLRRP